MSITLTDEQQEVFEEIRRFLREGVDPFFTVHGIAGTGKTTLLAKVADMLPEAKAVAFTGKAAANIGQKTGREAFTLHSLLYQPKSAMVDVVDRNGRAILKEDGSPEQKMVLGWDDNPRVGGSDIILLDECSMISIRHADDMLSTGARIIAFGDPGQLPPIAGGQFFQQPHATLATVHRQALDSPIIRQAHRVRTGLRYIADGDNFRVDTGRVSQYDIALCYSNKTRVALNRGYRLARGLDGLPKKGEPVMCFRNDKASGIYNGMIYELAEDMRDARDPLVVMVDGVPTWVENSFLSFALKPMDEAGEDGIPFSFGYATTVHKSQGSEWDRVAIIDEYPVNKTDRPQWLYTAITRAKQSCLIITRK